MTQTFILLVTVNILQRQFLNKFFSSTPKHFGFKTFSGFLHKSPIKQFCMFDYDEQLQKATTLASGNAD